jgi:peroxiredoxin
VLVVAQETPDAFAKYWQEKGFPFVGLPDDHERAAKLYNQKVIMTKLGRMPAMFVIDKKGIVRFAQYGSGMSDIPLNQDILRLLEKLKAGT